MRFTTPHGLTLAASLAALMIAAPLAFRHFEGRPLGMFNDGAVQTELRGAATGHPRTVAEQPRPAEPPRAASARQDGEKSSTDGPKLAMGLEKDAAPAAPAKVATELQTTPSSTTITPPAPPAEPAPSPKQPGDAAALQNENAIMRRLGDDQKQDHLGGTGGTARPKALRDSEAELSNSAPAPASPDGSAVRQEATETHPTSGADGKNVVLDERFSNAGAGERMAEMDATTARKGNRKVHTAVIPPNDIPEEISNGLGKFANPAPASPSDSVARPDTTTPAIVALKATSDDQAKAPAAKAPAPAPAAGYAGINSRGRIAHVNTEAGRRILENPKGVAAANPADHDPYAWMGDAGEQKAIVLEENRDKFEAKEPSPVKQVSVEPVSTFSIDVDTASYSFARRALNAGRLPPKDAVRVEEMINYFPYAYPAPDSAGTPFKPTVTVMPSPWNANNKLVHVAIKGYDLKSAERPRANLVLLMDVSGSMAPEDRLPLVKNAFRMLVDQLRPDDTVGIVTYASGSGIALEPTRAADKWKILAAIDKLGAGGSTAGAQGIQDAYRLAEAGFDKSAVNRIILATDGDFNVGITDPNELKTYIERKRQSGIFLSILGVGQGNHNDALMQTLAQNGNGTAAYVDTLNEARKVLVDEASSTLFTIAKDVKVQIEWNPARVAEYRLIGYETRALKREDFNNDHVDAGDIGSGHTVTAIYEVTPVGGQLLTGDLRYGAKTAAAEPVRREPADAGVSQAELGFLKLRYKRPNEDVSQLVTSPITTEGEKFWGPGIPPEQRFSVAVAAFGQLLKGSAYTQGYTFDDVLALAQAARGDDPFGYRAEFLNLVRLAKSARP